VDAPLENANPNRKTDTYSISDETYNHILKLNLLDLAAYDEASERLSSWVARSRASGSFREPEARHHTSRPQKFS
jgi:hypothetical protein